MLYDNGGKRVFTLRVPVERMVIDVKEDVKFWSVLRGCTSSEQLKEEY